ncbi:CAP-Gly domain-containing linker protein 1 isoform X2 [Triticum aestivum]|uniref:CAP-Gly domain-containing linker protein 1 isoform X2 n=1 Tax=Triticum aestivum TaxID=4565 RepID=UPI001D02FD19|nr:CAP-Gly domain-containing linker protein 1-like isoform X2 [Triticum aestivum]
MSSGGGGDDAGDGGRAEWQRIYDRVGALAAGRARLEARNRIQHEFWDARLHQAELSRSRWEVACRELLPSDDPKLAELLESDLEDSRTCEALLDTENSELLVQLREDGACVELNENTADHEHTSGDLISEVRKLKRTYATICWNKDKEATEAVQKLQQKIEELQVAACKKDDEIGILQAEASACINKLMLLKGKLDEMRSLDKDIDIQKLKVGQHETLESKFASLPNSKEAGNIVDIIQKNADHGAITAELRKLKQAYETLSSNKDKEISKLLEMKDFLLNQLMRMDKDNAELLQKKEVEAAQANEAAQKLQQNVEELQVSVRYKDDEIGRLRAEAGPLKIKEVEVAQANEAAQKLQQNVEELQVSVRYKDDEIGRLRAEAGPLKMKEVEVAQANKAAQKLQQNVEELQAAVRNKDDEIGKLRAEVEYLQQNVEELQVAVRNKDNKIGRLQAEVRILNIKQVEPAQKLQQNVDVLQIEVRNKDDENCRLPAEAANAEKKVPALEVTHSTEPKTAEASASTKALAVVVAASASPPVTSSKPGAGIDIDLTPPRLVGDREASPPFPPGFGPVARFKDTTTTAPTATLAVVVAKEDGNPDQSIAGTTDDAGGLDIDTAPMPPAATTTKTKSSMLKGKPRPKEQSKADKEGTELDSILGKRMERNRPESNVGLGENEEMNRDMYKKMRGSVSGEAESNIGVLGGKEATGIGATGELMGAKDDAHQEE